MDVGDEDEARPVGKRLQAVGAALEIASSPGNCATGSVSSPAGLMREPQFQTLLEEDINRLFIEGYGLGDELSADDE